MGYKFVSIIQFDFVTETDEGYNGSRKEVGGGSSSALVAIGLGSLS